MSETSLERAIALAVRAHTGQSDKNGDPYILHPLRVMLHSSLTRSAERIVAVLHDVVEDTEITVEWVRGLFGPEIAEAVDAISVRESEKRSDYYERVKGNPLAFKVKLADIADNTDPVRLLRLDIATRQRLTAKYQQALLSLVEAEKEG